MDINVVAADLHYLPGLEFFAGIAEADEVVFFPEERYQRQSYFNRTRIRLANKVETLSVPIVGRRPRIPLKEVQIDQRQDWLKVHIRGIQSAYGKAPFFEFYFPYFEQIFEEQHTSLWELNWSLLTLCLKLLGLPVKIRTGLAGESEEISSNIRGCLEPSMPFSKRNIYSAVPYFQLFGSDFDPNLSVLDLLFCEGTTAKSIILMSAKKQ